MKFNSLYYKGKKGEIRVWNVWTEGNIIKTSYGILNGEMLESSHKAEGKNIGKKNETTPEQQADKDAQSLWTHKVERKYSETVEGASEPLLLPMLAKEYDPKKVKFPAYIQPKLDGVRCLAFWEQDRVKLISRAGKEWTVARHIAKDLESVLPKGCMFDGELYVHGQSCQTITSWVKKVRDETLRVKYHIYDMPVVDEADDLAFDSRYANLEQIILEQEDDLPKSIVLVATKFVLSEKEVKDTESCFVEAGYEGAIVRNTDGVYVFAHRSSDLLKVKTFKDAEFEVINVIDGIGKFEGCACFICKNDLNDKTFECTMAVSMEEKAEQFENKEKYIGKKLTVKFFNRTDDDLPRFPVGKVFRDERDIG